MIILRQMTHHLGHVIEDIPDCDFLFRVKKLQASSPTGGTFARLWKIAVLPCESRAERLFLFPVIPSYSLGFPE